MPKRRQQGGSGGPAFRAQGTRANAVAQITVATTNLGLWRDCCDLDGIKRNSCRKRGSCNLTARPPCPESSPGGSSTRSIIEWSTASSGALLGGLGSGVCGWLTRLCYGEFLEAARVADFILCTGGHHLTTILTEDVICWQTCDMSVALLSGKPLVLWSQSIGPFKFHSEKNANQIKKIVGDSARDSFATRVRPRKWRVWAFRRNRWSSTCDSAFGLCDLADDLSRIPPSGREPIVGIAVYHGAHVDREAYIDAFVVLRGTPWRSGIAFASSPWR